VNILELDAPVSTVLQHFGVWTSHFRWYVLQTCLKLVQGYWRLV
jgi:hypothetical protein